MHGLSPSRKHSLVKDYILRNLSLDSDSDSDSIISVGLSEFSSPEFGKTVKKGANSPILEEQESDEDKEKSPRTQKDSSLKLEDLFQMKSTKV